MVEAIRVTGLRELRSALIKADKEAAKELRVGLKRAAEIVADDARGRIPVGQTGRARRAVKAGTSGAAGIVRARKSDVPYYGWLDFGTRQPISGRPRSIGPWKASGAGPKGGRFIYPALHDKRREVERSVEQAINRAMDKAGF